MLRSVRPLFLLPQNQSFGIVEEHSPDDPLLPLPKKSTATPATKIKASHRPAEPVTKGTPLAKEVSEAETNTPERDPITVPSRHEETADAPKKPEASHLESDDDDIKFMVEVNKSNLLSIVEIKARNERKVSSLEAKLSDEHLNIRPLQSIPPTLLSSVNVAPFLARVDPRKRKHDPTTMSSRFVPLGSTLKRIKQGLTTEEMQDLIRKKER